MIAPGAEPRPRRARLRTALTVALLCVPPALAGASLAGWLVYQDICATIDARFGGQRWEFASKIYSDAYPLYPGLDTQSDGFLQRLAQRGYDFVDHAPARPGQWSRASAPPIFELYLHSFEYPTHREAERLVRMELDAHGRVIRIRDAKRGGELYDVELEPIAIAGVHGASREDRREMSLDAVPVPLARAVVAVEDRRFFEHEGLDFRGLARAMAVNLRSLSVRQGGSTLTQQLMKNFFLTDDRTVTRKVREAAMAIVAERRYSKRDILESYLNEIYMGQRNGVAVHGMWEASSLYFDKEPRELTLGQMATLAGMIRAPNYYSPHAHPDRARARRDVVLRVLFDAGDIDQHTYETALAEPLGVVETRRQPVSAPYFVDYVRRELGERFPKELLTTQGYSIFTTLDSELQRLADVAVEQGLSRLERDHPQLLAQPGARLEAAMLVTNPRTGAILAMVGGRHYQASQYNRVSDARRQPGSVFKPVVYLAALGAEHVGDVHYSPSSVVMDEPFTWIDGDRAWTPENYERTFHGPVTLRTALNQSLNSATARIAQAVGIQSIRDLAVRLGVNPSIPAFPAIALGGWEVSPLEVARIYGVLADGGLAADPMAISKVVDRAGDVVEGHRLDVRRVVPATDAYLVTHLLEGVLDEGTARRARLAGLSIPAAGKTGTTNEYNDAWFAGYTPDLLAVVWVGFDRGAHLGLTGASAALPIWTQFMLGAVDQGRPVPFEVPSGIEFAEVDADTGGLATGGCRHVVREAFLKGEGPAYRCDQH